jgi:hypothetical protein
MEIQEILHPHISPVSPYLQSKKPGPREGPALHSIDSRQAQGMRGGRWLILRLGAIADDREANDLPGAGTSRWRRLVGACTIDWRRGRLNVATFDRNRLSDRSTKAGTARRACRGRAGAARRASRSTMVYLAIAATAAATTATVVAMLATAMAAAAVIHVAAASAIAETGTSAIAMATVTGDGLAVTAQQGDADNREKNRDA